MGFFDSVTDAVSSVGKAFSGGGGGGSGIGSLLSVGANIAGTVNSIRANNNARDDIRDANKDARKAAEEANALMRERNRLAQQQYEQFSQNAAPANEYYRRLLATEGGGLTAGQRQELDDVRRSSRNQLASSGLRGSGRATTAALRQVEADTLGRFTQENRARADMAAGNLSDQGFAATDRAQQTGLATAGRIGQGLQNAAATGVDSAYASAGAGTANARLQGQALGDITSIISSDIKDRTRASKYPASTKTT